MRTWYHLCAVLGHLALAPAALAEGGAAGQPLRQALSGKTVLVDTPMGAIPVHYAASGVISGRSKLMRLQMAPEKDTGRWWVSADQVCHRWSKWLSASTVCLKVRLEGAAIHWRSSDGRSGTARIVTAN